MSKAGDSAGGASSTNGSATIPASGTGWSSTGTPIGTSGAFVAASCSGHLQVMRRESQRRDISRVAVLEERSTRLRRDRRHEGLQGLRGRSQRNHGDVIFPVRLHVRLILLGGRRMSVHLDFGGRWDWARRGEHQIRPGARFRERKAGPAQAQARVRPRNPLPTRREGFDIRLLRLSQRGDRAQHLAQVLQAPPFRATGAEETCATGEFRAPRQTVESVRQTATSSALRGDARGFTFRESRSFRRGGDEIR